MGRRSQLPSWLSDAKIGPMQEESEDSGFIYYGLLLSLAGRDYASTLRPAARATGQLLGLTLPSDNGTWAVTLVTSSGDSVLKRIRDPICGRP